MKQILFYNLEKAKELKIKQLCTLMKIRFKNVAQELYMEPIGALAGIKGIDKTGIPFTGIPFSDELLLFINFDDDSLWDFLKRFRQAGVGTIALKAGLTPHNVTWNSLQLRDELQREREEIEKANKQH